MPSPTGALKLGGVTKEHTYVAIGWKQYRVTADGSRIERLCKRGETKFWRALPATNSSLVQSAISSAAATARAAYEARRAERAAAKIGETRSLAQQQLEHQNDAWIARRQARADELADPQIVAACEPAPKPGILSRLGGFIIKTLSGR